MEEWKFCLEAKSLWVCRLFPAHSDQRAGCGSEHTTGMTARGTGLSARVTLPQHNSSITSRGWNTWLFVLHKSVWQPALFSPCLFPCNWKITHCFSFARIHVSISHIFLGPHFISGHNFAHCCDKCCALYPILPPVIHHFYKAEFTWSFYLLCKGYVPGHLTKSSLFKKNSPCSKWVIL